MKLLMCQVILAGVMTILGVTEAGNPGQCGVNTASPKVPGKYRQQITNIVGGTETLKNGWPWQVLILRNKTRDANFVPGSQPTAMHCGGSIISKDYIVTAAHCMYSTRTGRPFQPDDLVLYVGRHHVQGYEPGSQQLRISKIIVHKQYSSRSYLNDIALLKVKDQIVMSNTVRRVCMPLTDAPVGKTCVVTGWGLTESGSTSKYLRQVYMSIVEPSYCVSKYQKTVVKITDNQLCAGADKGAKDSCSGDSGGPLVCRTDSTWHLNGIVSVGPKKCATEGVPGVYTKVTNYIHWIKENSGVQ